MIEFMYGVTLIFTDGRRINESVKFPCPDAAMGYRHAIALAKSRHFGIVDDATVICLGPAEPIPEPI